jgi:hypothetical protein
MHECMRYVKGCSQDWLPYYLERLIRLDRSW